MSFAIKIIDWYKSNGRDLPWRKTTDPYVIWLSEVILQQTRVEQGRPYFHSFIEAFPTVSDFAHANEEEVLRLWQGLGYYSRARNMHKAAKLVMEKFNGKFPVTYDELIQLPGIGDYTASAISSFAINEPRAVLDGNVFRVLSRYLGIDEPINSSKGKKVFQQLANELLHKENAGIYNQAIMDFGAIQCKPKAPLCGECVFSQECVALLEGNVSTLPAKLKGKASRDRYFHYFIIEDEGSIMMSKREEGDVWANLYEFPMIESSEALSLDKLLLSHEYQYYFGNSALEPVGGQIKHVLSHQNIYARFYKLVDNLAVKKKKDGWNYHLLEKMDILAKHKLIFTFIDEYMLTN